jgi:cullin 1
MIREFVKRWEDHKLMKQWMCNFFKYLDRFYVKRHNKKPLQEVAINKFRALIFDGIPSAINTISISINMMTVMNSC